MIIGCPKERKNGEKRVGLIPNSVKLLTENNIEVMIEKDAGIFCGYKDYDYLEAGAKIVDQETIWKSDLIIKVKEPQKEEYKFFKEGQIIFGFLHLAANPQCVTEMIKKNITAIAAETIKKDSIFNLLKPVSQIAGRRALFTAIHYLEVQQQGKGILLSGTDTVKAGKVLIVGGGEVGINSCDMALNIGCEVVLAEVSKSRIEFLEQHYANKKVTVIKSTEDNIAKESNNVDALISTVLVPGAKAPKVITKKITDNLTLGSVVIDVSADQGGSVQIMDSITSHEKPIKIIDGIVYYAVPNMPGAVPKTASISIQGSTQYIIDIAKNGIDKLIKKDLGFKEGIQIKDKEIKYDNLKKSYEEEL